MFGMVNDKGELEGRRRIRQIIFLVCICTCLHPIGVSVQLDALSVHGAE